MDSSVTVVEWGRDRVEHLSESRLEVELHRTIGSATVGSGALEHPAVGDGPDPGAEPRGADAVLDFDTEDDDEPRTIVIRGFGPRWEDQPVLSRPPKGHPDAHPCHRYLRRGQRRTGVRTMPSKASWAASPPRTPAATPKYWPPESRSCLPTAGCHRRGHRRDRRRASGPARSPACARALPPPGPWPSSGASRCYGLMSLDAVALEVAESTEAASRVPRGHRRPAQRGVLGPVQPCRRASCRRLLDGPHVGFAADLPDLPAYGAGAGLYPMSCAADPDFSTEQPTRCIWASSPWRGWRRGSSCWTPRRCTSVNPTHRSPGRRKRAL